MAFASVMLSSCAAAPGRAGVRGASINRSPTGGAALIAPTTARMFLIQRPVGLDRFLGLQ